MNLLSSRHQWIFGGFNLNSAMELKNTYCTDSSGRVIEDGSDSNLKISKTSLSRILEGSFVINVHIKTEVSLVDYGF